MDVYDALPLFPLSLVLYPEERLPLHIFEDRYKEMIGRCLREDIPFGIVNTNDERVARVGCTARVEKVLERYPDGRLDVLVRGEDRFHVRRILSDRAYFTAESELVAEPDEPLQVGLRERVITQHMKLLELAGRTVRPSLYSGRTSISYTLAHNAGLSNEQKQELLELLTENLRLAYLAQHFEALIPRVEQVEEFRRRVQSNGHFRDFPPELTGSG